MSKDALAGLYADMLEDDDFRDRIAADPSLLNDFDLTDTERNALAEEAGTEVTGFAMGSGAVWSAMQGGPQCCPGTSSRLGRAMNQKAGLPAGAPEAPGMISTAACCPWNKPAVGGFGSEVM